MRLGYACQNTSVEWRCDRTCKLLDKNPKEVMEKSILLGHRNVEDLLKILEWNEAHNIKFFRIPSDLFPHLGNTKLRELLRPQLAPSFTDSVEPHTLYKLGFTNYELTQFNLSRIGRYANPRNHRLTFHVTPYVKLGAPSYRKFISQVEICWHAALIEYMGLISSSITIHLGGVYNNKLQTIKRFVSAFYEMPEWVRKWVIIENDESEYNINDVLYVSRIADIPVCFDWFHYLCYQKYHAENPYKYSKQAAIEVALPLIIASWRGRRPKFHLAEQQPDSARGAHADFIKVIPQFMLDLDADIMLEAKCKEQALFLLRKKYNIR